MPRPTRLNIPGVAQHITQRGNNRLACFYADEDYRLYLELLESACRIHDCCLHAYVLMTNHVHLLITPSAPEGVSRVMQDLSRDYVRAVNRSYRRTGTLWEGRFKSSLVDTGRYCLTCYRGRYGQVPGRLPLVQLRSQRTRQTGYTHHTA